MAASTTPPNPKVRCARGVATVAQVNAGLVIVDAHADRTLTVLDARIRCHGTEGAGTSIDIVDTTGALNLHDGTHAVTFTRAGTVGNDHVLTFAGDANTVATNVGLPLTKGKGIKIVNIGSAITTTTHVEYWVYYNVTQ